MTLRKARHEAVNARTILISIVIGALFLACYKPERARQVTPMWYFSAQPLPKGDGFNYGPYLTPEACMADERGLLATNATAIAEGRQCYQIAGQCQLGIGFNYMPTRYARLQDSELALPANCPKPKDDPSEGNF